MSSASKEINIPIQVDVDANPIVEQTYDNSLKTTFKLAIQKFMENLVSVKVWTIFGLLGVTTFLCYTGKITGGEFIAVNGGVISTVYALREGFKVAKIKKLNNNEVRKINV